MSLPRRALITPHGEGCAMAAPHAARNLLSIPEHARPGGAEFFETLLAGGEGLVVERIISHGQTSPENFWYEQEKDEWIVLLEGQATLQYENKATISLSRGDCLFLPKHVKHRVVHTSAPCVWLAIHGDQLLLERHCCREASA